VNEDGQPFEHSRRTRIPHGATVSISYLRLLRRTRSTDFDRERNYDREIERLEGILGSHSVRNLRQRLLETFFHENTAHLNASAARRLLHSQPPVEPQTAALATAPAPSDTTAQDTQAQVASPAPGASNPTRQFAVTIVEGRAGRNSCGFDNVSPKS
jgi:hypothetical protein